MVTGQGLEGGTLLLMGSSAFSGPLPLEVTRLLDEAMEREMSVLVGEAHGASRRFQDYLKSNGYRNVVVGYANRVRYNAGRWPAESYGGSLLDKERAMIEECDCAVVIWTNRSGVIAQDLEHLRKMGKPCFVYQCRSDSKAAGGEWLDPRKRCRPRSGKE
jgi:hypothetical protein